MHILVNCGAKPPPRTYAFACLYLSACVYEMHSFVLTAPLHVAKMASHDDNALSLPFVDDIVAAEEAEAIIDDFL